MVFYERTNVDGLLGTTVFNSEQTFAVRLGRGGGGGGTRCSPRSMFPQVKHAMSYVMSCHVTCHVCVMSCGMAMTFLSWEPQAVPRHPPQLFTGHVVGCELTALRGTKALSARLTVTFK